MEVRRPKVSGNSRRVSANAFALSRSLMIRQSISSLFQSRLE